MEEHPDKADAPPVPSGRTSRFLRWLNAFQPHAFTLVGASSGLVVLAIVPLFISFSSTQIKDLFERFTGGCVLVLDKSSAAHGQVYVTGQIAGTMPERIPLIFEGRDALINTIDFDDAYRADQIPEPDDLTFHPMTYLGCPGALCELDGDKPSRRQAQIMLTDLRPEFTYRFRVRLIPDSAAMKSTPANLKVFALFDKGFKGAVCRVEPRRWFNFWVWATPLKKAALFIGVIVAGGLMLKWAKSAGEKPS
jgi:hypothetical protein